MPAQSTKKGGEDWGPWVRHNGKGCPVRVGTIVEVVCEDRFGFTMRQVACVEGGSYSSWDWTHFPELKKIIRYREKKPKGLSILEARMNELDLPARNDLIKTL
ncbi:hypothetical protein [Thioclava pacifica]|uniref:Uncharacterized protein n=1 Tax=Thioclava pacifica DSM 10166 TaxID=1353537 RepID=A0A074JFI6_9RHOB|nr:hypothetical protein [Thioclava pacifica]KEO56401.1 hypothetical protein TP2_02405 [Thioclava pacifica DSM 10166]